MLYCAGPEPTRHSKAPFATNKIWQSLTEARLRPALDLATLYRGKLCIAELNRSKASSPND